MKPENIVFSVWVDGTDKHLTNMSSTTGFEPPNFEFVVKVANDRQEKANAGNVTQKIHPPLKQSTLVHTQTHTYRQSYIQLKIHVRHTLNKGKDKGTALARSVVVIVVNLVYRRPNSLISPIITFEVK